MEPHTYTAHRTPYTLHPTPQTPPDVGEPYTLRNPEPYTLDPQFLNSKTHILRPEFLNPAP